MTWWRVGSRPATAGRSPLVLLSRFLVLAGFAAGEPAQGGEVDLGSGAGGLLVRGGDQAQVVDPGRGRVRAGGLRDGAVHVPAGDERGRGPGGLAVQEHLDDRQ